MAIKRDNFNDPGAGARNDGIYAPKAITAPTVINAQGDEVLKNEALKARLARERAVTPPAPPAAQPVNPFRDEQLRMIQALQRAAMGDPNSRAQQQMRDIYGQQRAQISSGISGARGVAAGAAQEMIQRNRAAADQAYNLDSRVLMSQEQQQAQQALLTELGYLRDQDINQAEEGASTQQRLQILADQAKANELGRKFKNWDDLNLLNQEWARMQLGVDENDAARRRESERRIAEGVGSALEAWSMQGKGK